MKQVDLWLGASACALMLVVACGDKQEPDPGHSGGSAGAGTAGQVGAADGVAGRAGASEAGSGGVSSSQAGHMAAGAGSGGTQTAGMAGTTGATGAAGATSGTAAGSGGTAADPGLAPGDLFASPSGKDSASGTETDPLSLSAALTKIAPGNAIQLLDGTYPSAEQLTIKKDNSGSDGKLKTLQAFGQAKPILDFSSQPYGKDSNPRGLQIDGSYWHVKGLTVTGSADNGIYVAGSHNIIEGCVTHANRDTGLQIGRSSSSAQMPDWPADNLILNCESYDNYDAPPGAGENADGFAAKLTVGEGNVFRGCVSHNNIDDGWDLYTKEETGPIGTVTIDQCIAHHNGTLTDGTASDSGDRNGFKLGGEKIAVSHVVSRSIAFANGKDGFTWNSNPGAIRLFNTLAFDNADGNYRFGSGDTVTKAVFTNNVSFWTSGKGQSDKALGEDAGGSNCFWTSSGTPQAKSSGGLTIKSSDFANSLADPKITRLPDGGLDFSPFSLAGDSSLINAGMLPSGDLPFDTSYYRDKPDLGAVESQ